MGVIAGKRRASISESGGLLNNQIVELFSVNNNFRKSHKICVAHG
jgi:hypothetical protein